MGQTMVMAKQWFTVILSILEEDFTVSDVARHV
jgi:hypothetical protein